MIKNYFKTMWRGLIKNKFYSTINILGLFALASVLALLIALGTIFFQSIKAAMANPVESLRTE
jgi:putative ABC transport system permease protein